ncbi:hypothetical protein D3C81_1830400 [compost metagenome]
MWKARHFNGHGTQRGNFEFADPVEHPAMRDALGFLRQFIESGAHFVAIEFSGKVHVDAVLAISRYLEHSGTSVGLSVQQYARS